MSPTSESSWTRMIRAAVKRIRMRRHEHAEVNLPATAMPPAEVLASLTAAAGAASVIAKAKIESRTEIRKAEIEAETRRLEITEETKREQLRIQGESPPPDES